MFPDIAPRMSQTLTGWLSERKPSCRKGRWPDESSIWRAQVLPLRIPLAYSMLASKQGWLTPRRGVTRGQKSKGSGGTGGGTCPRRPGRMERRRRNTAMARNQLRNWKSSAGLKITVVVVQYEPLFNFLTNMQHCREKIPTDDVNTSIFRTCR